MEEPNVKYVVLSTMMLNIVPKRVELNVIHNNSPHICKIKHMPKTTVAYLDSNKFENIFKAIYIVAYQ